MKQDHQAYARGRSEGHARGFEKGYQKGYSDGLRDNIRKYEWAVNYRMNALTEILHYLKDNKLISLKNYDKIWGEYLNGNLSEFIDFKLEV